MGARVFWSTAEWAAALAELPARGALPCRTVLVPRERVAHALRRELVRADREDALVGTRFLSPVGAAVEVLQRAGVRFEPGEEAVRPARLLAVFGRKLRLGYFDLAALRETPGWEEAFARAIARLEDAGLRPADLPPSSKRWGDVSTIWKRAEQSADSSWTSSLRSSTEQRRARTPESYAPP